MNNERIKELAERAFSTVQDNTPDAPNWFLLYSEKFAELIVRECATVVDEKTVDNGFGTADGWCEGSDLLKHFGVK